MMKKSISIGLRLAKQSSVDLLSTGRIQPGNVDAILMMGDEDQASTLNAAIRYAGAIDNWYGKNEVEC